MRLSGGYLISVLTVAMVLGELDAKTLLRVRNPLHRSHGNLELTIATAGADSAMAEPLHHSMSALFHA